MNKEITEIVQRLFPDLPEDAQLELVEVVEQCIYQFGVGMVCRVGKVVESFSRK